ncbi:DUF6146 family protein [Chishuiella sp.]|uniref:DUF6146 family protein n=1 Tax=Chishuiella sp. TaxID=1969467 RepID=UPI0028B10D6A|nr:DUF6146 family protein [Chishuiella sp.]
MGSIILLFNACSTNKHNINAESSQKEKSLKFEPNDDGEYDIIVLDPQYDVYLKSIALPKDFYTEQYYKQRNRLYVTIWNQRHMQPFNYDPNLYAVSIDLDPRIDYGYSFEYKLFNFFKFIEYKYHVRIR